MKRQHISLEEIANYNNLLLAVYKASKAKRSRVDVKDYFENLANNLSVLSTDILLGKLPYGHFKAFCIHDPKKRIIHAACFEDRIFHHAIMNIAGEKLEKSMFYHSYACRPNKGVHKAVYQVQKNLQRYQWFVKIDVSSYFSCINHACLLSILNQRFKGKEIVAQLTRIIKSCPDRQQLGLPIGSLTSQYFANIYLDGLDRLLASEQRVNANIRYMDDVIWWCKTKQQAKQVLSKVIEYLKNERMLEVKSSIQILPSLKGVTYCGFRVSQGALRLSRRRKKSINKKRLYWEQQYKINKIDVNQLQLAYASIHAISHGTDSLAWRKKQLQEKPAING